MACDGRIGAGLGLPTPADSHGNEDGGDGKQAGTRLIDMVKSIHQPRRCTPGMSEGDGEAGGERASLWQGRIMPVKIRIQTALPATYASGWQTSKWFKLGESSLTCV